MRSREVVTVALFSRAADLGIDVWYTVCPQRAVESPNEQNAPTGAQSPPHCRPSGWDAWEAERATFIDSELSQSLRIHRIQQADPMIGVW